jgi:hypothetical protein
MVLNTTLHDKASSSHILGLVDENGYVVIYNTNKYGEQAIIKGML